MPGGLVPDAPDENEALALLVRETLAAAGLPVTAPGLPGMLCQGAAVDVEVDIDEGPAVVVTWASSRRLEERASWAYRRKQLEDPTHHFNYDVIQVMLGAMKEILTRAGFETQDNDDEYHVPSLVVLSAPQEPIYWGPSQEEMTLTGWHQDAAASQGPES